MTVLPAGSDRRAPQGDGSPEIVPESRPESWPECWLSGGGEMGDLIRSIDWSTSPLGPLHSWPKSLQTTLHLCLASNMPISLAWGPGRVLLYNDAYRPICGDKHPRAMGQDLRECWALAWPIIEEPFTRSQSGTTSVLENMRFFLDRHGYLEETFFSFAFSPVRDGNQIVGIFNPTTETTSGMLSGRRRRALVAVANPTRKNHTVEEACEQATQSLGHYPEDLPFVLFYLLDEREREARLLAGSGLPEAHRASPERIDLTASAHIFWPLSAVVASGKSELVDDLETRFGHFACGDYPESLKQAILLPIIPPGCPRPIGILVAGVSPRLAWNESYRSFYNLLAAAVTTQVANARALVQEQRRVQALAEIERAKTIFFSNVSHEFRTPLTLILSLIEDELTARDLPLPADRLGRLEIVHRNALRVLKLVNNLLDFSRIEAGRMQPLFQATDLASFTVELSSMFQSVIEKAGLTLAIHCPQLPWPVFVDRDMWEKIVLNLLSNAFKHTFTGTITVSLRSQEDHVTLLVQDTGVGIPAAELPRLFERFHRVRETRARTHEGSGIGLALVRELVALHGGTVHVESREGRGSTFSVRFKAGTTYVPAGLNHVHRPTGTTAAQSDVYVAEAKDWLSNTEVPGSPSAALPPLEFPLGSPETRPQDSRRPRILLTDDNRDLRDYLSRLLGEHYDVAAFADGAAAVNAARTNPPDLILTDIMMPGMDGLEMLRALKADPRTRIIPVILLSARAGEEAALAGLNAGADDYLAKPFSARELLARVRSHLEPARAHRAWTNNLEQSNRELESFNYSVSHDLRAPLRAIDGFSKALLDECAGTLNHEAMLHLHRIRAGTQKMSTIIDDLLTLSNVNQRGLRRERVNLTVMARRVIADLKTLDPGRNVSVTIAGNLCAHADARMVTIALVNLLGNSWKYTSRRAEAHITFGRQTIARETVFYVRDNGAGFDTTRIGELFKPFHRLHQESEFEGTGIGLATTQRIISRHGGRIWAEAMLDRGTTFYFTLEGTP